MADDSLETGARRICERLRNAGHTAYFAGGCVRDRLLGIAPQDIDIATSAKPEEVESLFKRVIPVGRAFGVLLVLEDDRPYEVATFRTEGTYSDGRRPDSVEFANAETDAKRRDFTINALYLDPETDVILDFVDGRADIDARIIRTVGDPEERLSEDCLRLLRCVRLSAQLDFAIAPETFAALQRLAPTVRQASAERIRDELTRMLIQPRAGEAFRLLDRSGLMEHVLPEVSAMKGVEQPPEYHPEGDVFVHTMMLLDRLEAPTPELAFGALLHDVGKPETQTMSDRIRFNEHDKVGAEMAYAICRRLKLSNESTERICTLVRNHMKTAVAPDMREAKRKRFVREDYFPELLALLRLDCLASHGDLQAYDWIRHYIDTLPEEARRPEPLLCGDDLIALGYTPGPRFKEILTAVEDAQLEGELADETAARDFVQQRFPLN